MRSVRLSRYDELLLTRERGREIALNLPEADHLVLDFQGVEVASPSFLDELIKVAAERGISLAATNVNRRTKENLRRLERVNADRSVALTA